MILAIAIICLSVGSLLFLNSLRFYSREIVWLALMNGIFVIQSAHVVLDGIIFTVDDHPLMVNSVFTLLYIPLFSIASSNGQLRPARVRLIIFCSTALFAFLYYNIFIVGAKPLISYVQWVWQLSGIRIIAIGHKIWIGGYPKNFVNWSLRKSHHDLLKIWCMVIAMPYLVGLVDIVFPAEYFVLPYRPLISTLFATQLATCTALARFMSLLMRHKTLVDKLRSVPMLSTKLRDYSY